MTIVDALRRAASDAYPRPWRDRFAALVFIVAFGAGLHAFMNLEPQTGVSLAVEGDRVVIADVQPWSQAAKQGMQPGMVVVNINGQPVLVTPGDGWAKPTPDELSWITIGSITGVDAIAADDVPRYRTDTFDGQIYSTWTDAGWALDNSGWAIAVGVLIFGVAGWYLLTGRGGAGLQPLAIPIAVASAIPLPLYAVDLVAPVGPLPATVLLMLGVLPLADGISGRIEERGTRRDVRIAVAVIAVVVVALAWWGVATGTPVPGGWRLLGAAAIPLLPAIVASRPRASALAEAGVAGSRRVAESSELVLVALTPAVATLPMTFPAPEPLVWPILLWLAFLLAAARFTVRPLLRVATRAQLQRDLVVAAMEAERARLAADLHDDALQDLTLLVRRLDAAGDTGSAAQARAIADRLRDICGDLRLPILDDLGVGPALDWLVVRIERLAGGEVRLERADGTRPPPEIELAVFRVAQEALANAVKHGRPPIVVRYQATESGVSLSIDDAGPGIDGEAREQATSGGHFGLLNMQQRAEAIGALLDVRRWPGGGTHVAFEWRAR
jgi:signal transduction histidine kinase